MKCLKNICKNFVLRSDLFAATPTLRIHGEPSYETTFGGCLSILLVCAFAAIFSTSFIGVLQKVNVSASLNLEDNPYDTEEISGIRLAVGIETFDFSEPQRYFNIILKLTSLPLNGNETSVEIPMTPCVLADWQDEGENFGKLFEVYHLDKMLCPSPTEALVVAGFAGSDTFKTMSIMVEQCRNGTSTEWTCHSPPTIRNKFDTHFMTKDFFKASLVVLNTIISPQQENATKTVLENEIFLTFSNTSGARSEIKLGRYSIVTDNSIWPLTEEIEETGYYIADKSTYTIGLYSTHYIRVEIEKSRTIYEVTRSHDKIDEMLSYVGGLFALLFAWIFFFIGSYNEYKYEITVAEHGFALDETGRKVREDSFGFLTYLKYCLYDWIKTIGIPLSWKRMEDIDMAREEANEQMDVTYLMKRMQRFEMINKFLLGEHNLVLTSLAKPHTLDEVKKLRKITQYYDKVIKIENEENLLREMIRISTFGLGNQIVNDNGSEMVKMGTIFDKELENNEDEDLDLDSEDEEAEGEILEAYKSYSTGEKNNEVSHKIMVEVSQKMKERLEKIKRRERRSKQKSKIILEDVSSELNESMNTNVGFNIMNLFPKQN